MAMIVAGPVLAGFEAGWPLPVWIAFSLSAADLDVTRIMLLLIAVIARRDTTRNGDSK